MALHNSSSPGHGSQAIHKHRRYDASLHASGIHLHYLGLAFRGIDQRQLAAKPFDDLSFDEMRALAQLYNDRFFDDDYPFAGSRGLARLQQ